MTDSSPLVSVVIPAFNCAGYIAEAIESVLAQTFQDFEIIVVDDGSTDETSEVVSQYASRVQLVSQNNQGVAMARNVGVARAQGKLIAFLDADDVFFPEKLAKQVALFERSPGLGLVISGWQIITQAGEIVSQATPWKEKPVLDLEVAVLYKPARPSATMVKKSWFQQIGGFDAGLSSAEDLDFLLRVMLAGAKASWLTEVQVSYRQHVGSLMTQGELLTNTDVVMTRFFDCADVPSGVRRLRRKERYQSLSWLGAKMYFEGQLEAMESCLKQSLAFAEGAGTTIVLEWFQVFRGYATEYGYELQSYQLTRSAGWQAVMALVLPQVPKPHEGGQREEAREYAESFGIKTTIEEGQEHVLLYSDDPGAGGILQCNHAIICHLAHTGYKTTHAHFGQDTPLAKEEASMGVQAVDLGYHADSDFTRSMKDIEGAKQLFRARRPDLIIFSDGWPFSNVAAKQAAFDLGIPYIIVLGFIEPSCVEYDYGDGVRYRDLVTLQYERAQSVIAVSQENLKLLRRLFRLPDSIGEVIYNGRPANYFELPNERTRQRLRKEFDIPADGVVCFTSGRLEAVKGYQYQIEAIRQLKTLPVWEKLYFVWAGPGAEYLSQSNEAALKDEINRIAAAERVTFLGQRWDIPDWLDASDIFILPSEAEGMPLSVMEAMAKGLPVVASEVSGIPEELGETGRLLSDPKVDAEKMVDELVEVMALWAGESAEIRQRVGRQCQQRARALFHQETMVKQYAAAVKKALWESDGKDEMRRTLPSEHIRWTSQETGELEHQFRYMSWIWKSWECYVREEFEAMDKALEMAMSLNPVTAEWPILGWGELFSTFSKERGMTFDGGDLRCSKVWQKLIQRQHCVTGKTQ